MPRVLHPVLKARAHAVKVTHARLVRTVPGFTSRPPREQFKAVQAHLRQPKP